MNHLTEEEQKHRDEIEDRFLLVQVLSLVREFLADKRAKEAAAIMAANAGQKKDAKEAQS